MSNGESVKETQHELMSNVVKDELDSLQYN